MGPSTPLRVLGGEALAMCVGPMVLPLILWFVSHQGEMNKTGVWMASFLAMTLRVCSLETFCLDGFVPRYDAKRERGLPIAKAGCVKK